MSFGRAFFERRLISLLDHAPSFVARRVRSDSRVAQLLRPLVNVLVPPDVATVRVRSGVGKGIQLVIKPREEKYYWTGAHEPEVQLALVRELARRMTVWDVGAHVGFFTALAARAVGDTGRVHAFEPQPQNRARLRQALRLNGLEDVVVVHDLALAARSGSASFYRHRYTSSWTLVEERGDAWSSVVSCATIDELAGTLGVPDLIKIDAEGAELEVLRGGLDLLGRPRAILVIEFSSTALVDEARRLLPGYIFEQLSGRHWLLRPDVAD